MSEVESIATVSQPGTRQSVAADLRRLGIESRMVLLVHSSLSKMGWVNGGPVAVIQALMDVLTEDGTLVMPTHSGDYSDPAKWQNPPVPQPWQETIRETMPLFDPRFTPTRGMGRIPELFRTWPGVQRSLHPQTSFAAWGRYADVVTDGHTLEYSLGENSPLARVYDLDGSVLLLGVGHGNNTSLHLAEYRAPAPSLTRNGAPWSEAGRRVWKEFDDVDINDDLFPEVGQAFERAASVEIGRVAAAECRLMSQRAAVDFAQAWFGEYRARQTSVAVRMQSG